ncbi:MAG: pyridoxal-phosphate dependent enzyme [Pseudomonadota bacterium]
MLSFGTYPTAVQLLEELSTPRSALWVKRDDLTNAAYGGNKVRKLGRLLADARARGKQRVVTIGPIGSHHVLATGIFAKALGMQAEAILIGQPRTAHVLEMVRADLAQGIRLFPARSYAEAGLLLASRIARGAYYIPVGGSNRLGALGFVDAAAELAAQVQARELPEPDVLVAALGSGGTVAGLAAGLAQTGLRTRVLGVTVADPAWVVERRARALVKQLSSRAVRRDAQQRLEFDRSYLGRGYGHTSALGEQAAAQAARAGLTLDATYTGKTFAAALARVAAGRERTILYWHTLSSAALEPLLHGAPDAASLSEALLQLAT